MCPELSPPDNGAVSYSCNGSVSIAEYTCSDGYSLVNGDVVRLCHNNGVWNGTAPSCSDGKSSVFEYVYVLLEYLKLHCIVEITISRSIVILLYFPVFCVTCVINRLLEKQKCPFLDAPSNGFVVITGFQPPANATYFCNEGYVLMNGDQVQECMPSHSWSGTPASCQSEQL